MQEPEASKAVLTLLNDLVDGTGPAGSMLLNPNDPGLLKSLSLLSAEQASAIEPGGRSSVAAHVDHLRYGLELLNRWSGGEENVFENGDFSASWTRTSVSAEEWVARCEALAREAHAWARAIDLPATGNGPGIDVAIASVVHLAYHLGAIRQINGLLRGPVAHD
jgi:hypothetical protein